MSQRLGQGYSWQLPNFLTSLVSWNTCNITRNTCNITRNTRNIKGNTYNITINTCNISGNTCNITRNTCNIKRNTRNITGNIIALDGWKQLNDKFSRFHTIVACDGQMTDILQQQSPHYAYASRGKSRNKSKRRLTALRDNSWKKMSHAQWLITCQFVQNNMKPNLLGSWTAANYNPDPNADSFRVIDCLSNDMFTICNDWLVFWQRHSCFSAICLRQEVSRCGYLIIAKEINKFF